MISERLTYNKFTPDDFFHYTRWYTSDEVMKYINGRGLTPHEAQERFAKALAMNEQYPELGLYAAFQKTSHEFVGITKLVHTSPWQAEVGYGSLPEFWGKGYATEMLTGTIDYAKTIHSIRELIAIVNPLNAGSIKVLRNQSFELYKTGTENEIPVEYYKLNLA